MKKKITVTLSPEDIRKLISNKYGYRIEDIQFVFKDKDIKAGYDGDSGQMYDTIRSFDGVKIEMFDDVNPL